MTVKYVKGDALEYADKEGYCMIHVCNNKGGFGGGKTALATQVKEKFPEVYKKYLRYYKVGGVACGDIKTVVNLIAQDGYGARWKGVKYFKEDWFMSALEDLLAGYGIGYDPHTIVVPFNMGADRAGGDWEWIINKTEEILGDYYEILVVEFEK